MYIEKLASMIKNDILSGLAGYHSNLSINLQQLQDEIIACRLEIITTYFLNGNLPIKDLLMAINCVDVDCKSLERCSCTDDSSTPIAHFEIPQLITNLGKQSIDYIGSIDRKNKFSIVSSLSELEFRKYKKRASNKPYVWIDYAPNENGMLDCFVFNAPFLKQVSVVGAFKDPRQLQNYSCCSCDESDINYSFIDQLVKEKLVKEKVIYYRQYKASKTPNDQSYT